MERVYRTSTADRTEGPLHLLAFDAIHDLALVKTGSPGAVAGRPPLRFRPRDVPMAQGERIYSLGNPLDVGFAVIEGTYNGLVERSFYPTIFFAGSLNPGVSGGPTLDQQGQVMGINVAARTDGEQVSFPVTRCRCTPSRTRPACPPGSRLSSSPQPAPARRAGRRRHACRAGEVTRSEARRLARPSSPAVPEAVRPRGRPRRGRRRRRCRSSGRWG